MDTTKILADLKKRPGFTENVGMVLAVPQERVEEALERLASLGEPGWLVGHVLPLRDGPQLLLS